MENNELFVQSVRRKLRFDAGRGQVTTEDLWDLPLTSLDNIAVALDEKVQKAGKKSFVAKRSASTLELGLAFDVVKYVIDTKLAEEEARKVNADKAAQKQSLKELLERKKLANLENLSEEELQKKLAELG